MGGLYGVAAKKDCVADLFYGTDYHSHLGTRRGGMAVKGDHGFTRFIHDITNADDCRVDLVAGIPDSGTGHAIGYANRSGVPYARPFAKYTPTWPRSFMPQDQRVRDLVARPR